jgi:hypothetical protein
VTQLVAGTEYANVRTGERLALPIALGLSIILAGLSDSHVVLTGDKSAWKENWGTLLDVSNFPEISA